VQTALSNVHSYLETMKMNLKHKNYSPSQFINSGYEVILHNVQCIPVKKKRDTF